MRFRVSIASFQVTLLTAMGFDALTACGGHTFTQTDGHSAGGAASGGEANGGAPAGGATAGGAANGGRWSGGASGGGNSNGGSGGGNTNGGRGGGGSGGTTPTGGGPSNGGSGGTSNGGSGGTSSGGVGGVGPCESPVAIVTPANGAGATGGFVRCADGTVRRPVNGDCAAANIDPNAGPKLPATGGAGGVGGAYACLKNSECTAQPYGTCQSNYLFGRGPSTDCTYGCVKDSDCKAGFICLCGDPVGTCVEAKCASDEDCASGAPCMKGDVLDICGPTTTHFTCGPLCVTNEDCPTTGLTMTCKAGDCVPMGICGRPFVIGRAPRLAGVEIRSDWGSSLSPDVASLPSDARGLLADHYTAIGLMEHASVAAFARFSLELLGLGAPAELVRLASDALGDEMEHAKLSFGLATAYAGRDIGPGSLDVTGALEPTPLVEKLRIAFLEACIGETCAAVEAAEAAERATDEAVVAVLRRIAADETRHAALGWKFAKWALGTMDVETRATVLHSLRALVDGELDTTDAPATMHPHSEALAAHGVLAPSARFALRRATIRDVVLPCLRTLAAAGARPAPALSIHA